MFDENIFPFSKLHPNAGSRLRSEVLLLPSKLLNPFTWDELRDDHGTNNSAANSFCEDTCDMQEETGTGIQSAPPGADLSSGSGLVPATESAPGESPSPHQAEADTLDLPQASDLMISPHQPAPATSPPASPLHQTVPGSPAPSGHGGNHGTIMSPTDHGRDDGDTGLSAPGSSAPSSPG